jgi:hypothetical protein
METIIALTSPSEKKANIKLLPLEITKKQARGDNSSLRRLNLKSVRKPYFKFYKVLKNETSVTEVVTNDFKIFHPAYRDIKIACVMHTLRHPAFFLPAYEGMFCGFTSRVRAMEYAKAGALKYISKLIEEGGDGYGLLLRYREDHYEDLNINLTDRNIQKIERELEER